jgi:hypothetical protein
VTGSPADPYFHAVFSVPHELNVLALENPRCFCDLLRMELKAVRGTKNVGERFSSFVGCFLTAMIPTRRAISINPTEVFRHE